MKPEKNRTLLVECCHVPQLLFAASLLQNKDRKRPDLFSLRTRQQRALPPGLEPFHQIYRLSDAPKRAAYSPVVFPLWNRGYARIKWAAWKLPGLKLKLAPDGTLHELSRGELIRSILAPLDPANLQLADSIKVCPYPSLGQRVLLIEKPSRAPRQAFERKLKALLRPDSQVTRLNSESILESWKKARSEQFDSVVVTFSRGQSQAVLDLLPLFMRVPQIVFLEEQGEAFLAERRDLTALLAKHFRSTASDRPDPRILMLQTEISVAVEEAVGKLKAKNLYPDSEILLVCRHEDRKQLGQLPQVDHLLEFTGSPSLKDSFHLWRKIRQFDADMVCAIFSGRPVFRKQKLFFWLSGIRRHLIFNSSLDLYPVTLSNLRRTWRQEPRSFDATHRVLFIQTASSLECIRALQQIQKPSVVPNARITVFCREDQTKHFASAGVESFITYGQDRKLDAALLRELMRLQPDVVSAIFSGRPIFRKQKLLFLLFPSRAIRLLFNEHLDCFYLTRDQFKNILPSTSVPLKALRLFVKVILFFPRFVYLLTWTTGMYLKRKRHLRKRNLETQN